MMPEMDGLETLHKIKELSSFPCQNTPIVVLTANAVSGAKENYLSEGFDDFLSKPIVPEKLEQMIQHLLPEELLVEVVEKPEEGNKQNVLDSLISENLVDGLDWNYAWLHLPDRELLEYSMKEFYAQIEFAAERLEQVYQQLIDEKQFEPYRIQVHAMKSLAATIGIVPLAGMAKILEYAAKDKKIEIILSMTTIFLEEWRSYQQKLQGVFGITKADKQDITDFSVVQALVEMVRICMQEMDIDQADSLIHQLQTYQYSEQIEPILQNFAEAVTNLDLEEINRLADLLIEQIG